MAIRKTRLPSAYQQVEYIESSGTQYIDTQYQTSSTTKVVSKFLIPDDTFANENIFYGQTTYTYNRFCFSYYNTSSTSSYSKGLYFFGSLTSAVVNGDFINQVIESEITKTSIIINGVNYSNSNDTSSSDTLWLFRCGNKYSNNRLYYLKIYDNNVLVRNFIPCYRKADSVIGLYDTVNDVFYTNAGSGDFTKGNDVMPKVKKLIKNNDYVIRAYKGSSLYYNALPSEFKAVEYIESDGTQYIDTGVIPTNNTEVNADFIVVNFNSNVVNYMFGNYETGKLFALYRNTSDIFGVMFSNYDNFSSYQIQLDTRYKAKLNSTGAYINGSSIKSFTTLPDFTATNSLYIFKGNGSSRPPAILKLYGFTIKKSNKVIRKLIPCYRVSDTTIGLYDLVNGVFYTNAGTGTFTKGANI